MQMKMSGKIEIVVAYFTLQRSCSIHQQHSD